MLSAPAGDRRCRSDAARGADQFRYNPQHDTIDVGGHDFAMRKKYRDALR